MSRPAPTYKEGYFFCGTGPARHHPRLLPRYPCLGRCRIVLRVWYGLQAFPADDVLSPSSSSRNSFSSRSGNVAELNGRVGKPVIAMNGMTSRSRISPKPSVTSKMTSSICRFQNWYCNDGHFVRYVPSDRWVIDPLPVLNVM